MPLQLFNTLTRQKETFAPLQDNLVRMYNCGPTVYAYPTIGNWRSFVFADLLRRTLLYSGYQVKQVMNLTDVGHMTMTEEQKRQAVDKEITDSEVGVDRMSKAAAQEGKTVWEVAQFYIDDFQSGLWKLAIEMPEVMPRATDHIVQQIEMIRQLEAKGYTYQTAQAVYFDVAKFPDYGKLSGQKLEDKLTGAREDVNVDTEKRNPADFRLWQIADADHAMQWDSPWGRGFPGWHIECSAMSVAYLGAPFDIHTGGVDHIPVHHENEIAQTEAALGVRMAALWMHGEFLLVDGGRMGKSLGNAYTLQDLEAKGIHPLALRYLFLNAHYRSKQNFTWESLAAAQNSLKTLREIASAEAADGQVSAPHQVRFTAAIQDDLNLPQALAVVWDAARDNALSTGDRGQTLRAFDRVLGLGLGQGPLDTLKHLTPEATATVEALVAEREQARRDKLWQRADEIRNELKTTFGVTIEDTAAGTTWTLG